MKQVYIVIQGTVAAFIAWLSAKMGILLPVMGVLMGMMVMDYITGMLASKREALDHPDDPTYGWCSRRGAEGIIKKVGYLCVIAVAMVVDYLILRVAAEAGFEVATKAFFGLLVAVWYVLNELLSIIENAGRMGAPVPEWLMKYVSVLKNKIDSQGDGTEELVGFVIFEPASGDISFWGGFGRPIKIIRRAEHEKTFYFTADERQNR